MKIGILITVLLAMAWPLGAQVSEVRYFGQGRSLINWQELDHNQFLDFTEWKLQQELRSQTPSWETVIRERALIELMGRALECVGECRVYKGEQFNSLRFKSALHQGDEVVTERDSYLWIYLMDGTLVRLSPETSITLKELNIGRQENFLHIRINSGNVLWLSRTESKYQEKDFRETDTLFLPLDFYEANSFTNQGEEEAETQDLFSLLIEKDGTKMQYDRLNRLIEFNNSLTNKKKTYSFAVMPNGTIFGPQLNMEFIVLLGGKSYFKQRSPQELGLEEGARALPLTFFYRGYENTRETAIQVGSWYEVDSRGRSIASHNPSHHFGMGEFITSNIPTFFVARELLLQLYSRFAYESLHPLVLAQEHGYRQWGRLDQEGSDLNLRLNFLKEHTRRVETTNLLTLGRFRERLMERGERLESMEYSPRYFQRALVEFQRNREVRHYLTGRPEEILNSTKKPLWHRMHAKPQGRLTSPTF